MATRISDMRPIVKDLDGAKAVMAKLAQTEIAIERRTAMAEKRIATIKARRDADNAEDLQTQSELKTILATFIEGNRHLFKRPKKVKTDWGTFGIQKVTQVVITDKDALINDLLDLGYLECLKTTRKILKPKIKDRLKDKQTLQGCTLHEGDTATYKVAKVLIDEAKDQGVK